MMSICVNAKGCWFVTVLHSILHWNCVRCTPAHATREVAGVITLSLVLYLLRFGVKVAGLAKHRLQ